MLTISQMLTLVDSLALWVSKLPTLVRAPLVNGHNPLCSGLQGPLVIIFIRVAMLFRPENVYKGQVL